MADFSLPRRRALLTAVSVAAAARWAHAAPATLPTAQSLLEDLSNALAAGKPLLVMVSLAGCPFCHVVREHYLAPMRDREGLAVVQVDMRSKVLARDFKGQSVSHDDLVRAWNVKVAPTVLFFGRGGTEVAERLVGGYIPDFYGAYLDERTRTATKAVRG